MRVEVVVQQLCAPVPGGTGRYTAQLVGALLATMAPGDEVSGVVATRCAAAATLGIPVRSLHVNQRILSRTWERGYGPRVGQGADIVHAPTMLVPGRWGAAALVVTIHDLIPWIHPELLTARGARFHRTMGERAARTAQLIVTPTEAVAAQARAVLAPECPVVPVHLGVSGPPPPGDSPERVKRWALGPYVLFVGTAEPRKGLHILIEAMTALPSEVSLVVVGPTGWGDVNVPALARRAGISERVVTAGRVDDLDLSALYAGALALALPSAAEGFGLPVVEAMARGAPVVTSDDPALVEVAGGAGLIAPVGDAPGMAAALGRLVEDSSLRKALSRSSRDRAAAFTWEATARRTWGLYAQLA